MKGPGLIGLLIVLALSACRFPAPLDLPVKPPDKKLDGLWEQHGSQNQTLLIRSVGDGRYRLLASQGSSRHVLDVHISVLDKYQVAQARLMATIDAAGQPVPPDNAVWSYLTIARDGESLALRWIRPIPGVKPTTTRGEMTRLVRDALTRGDALGEVRRFKRTETARTKRL